MSVSVAAVFVVLGEGRVERRQVVVIAGVDRLGYLLGCAAERFASSSIVGDRRTRLTVVRRDGHGQDAFLEVTGDMDRPPLVAKVTLELAEDRRRGDYRELFAVLRIECRSRSADRYRRPVRGHPGVRDCGYSGSRASVRTA